MTHTTKHTPGPWSTFGPVKYQIYGGDPVRRIAVVDYTAGSETDEHNANANLIAAAPAMYEALREIVEAVGSGEVIDYSSAGGWYIEACAVLAQAEGR